jgi:hypothetical protein
MWNPFSKRKSNKRIVQELRWWYEHELELVEEHKNLDVKPEDCNISQRDHELIIIEMESILGIPSTVSWYNKAQ